MEHIHFLSIFVFIYASIASLLHCDQNEQLLVAIIPTYENRARAEANLRSILAQKYENWHGIIILDNPQDGTIELYQELLPRLDAHNKFTLIINSQRHGPLRNHWIASHCVPDEAIIINIDGDDALPHPYVFNIINQKYTPDVWATWGSYRSLPADLPGNCRAVPFTIIEQNKWRELPLPFCTSHLRTFRACLFKQVKLQDLTYRGNFWPCAGDIAFFWPILEMAGHHAQYCPEYLYEYWETDINEYKVRLPQVLSIYNHIKTLPPYAPLKELPKSTTPNTADMIIFSYKRPLQLYALLESLELHMHNLGTAHVLYRAGGDDFEAAYACIKQTFPHVHFIQQDETLNGIDFQPLLKEILDGITQRYLLFAVDDIIVTDHIDCSICIAALQKTHAHGFFLRLGTQLTHNFILGETQAVPPLLELEPDLYAWHFRDGTGDWAYPNSVDMVIYPKEWVEKFVHEASFSNPTTLEALWFDQKYVDWHAMGLCHRYSKLVNIPLNAVQNLIKNPHMNICTDHLLKLFQHGGKINIKPFAGKLHPAVHMPYTLELISR